MSGGTYRTIVVGSGSAGLFTALEARVAGPVLVLTKSGIEDANTFWAQGGIAAAMSAPDSAESHLRDTLAAGAGLVDDAAARLLCEEAPGRIRDLLQYGVPFDRRDGELVLGREAAHSASRIVHAGGDRTGAAMEVALAAAVRAAGIEVRDSMVTTRLLVEGGRVRGVEAQPADGGAVEVFEAEAVVLATGGAGQLYSHTTNPEVATGDGIALAFDAGAEVADLEFFQFHPTALRHRDLPPHLISEAVRGEGAILRNVAGEAFMERYHPLRELAPRDVVARAIVAEMRATASDHVLLDCTHLSGVDLPERFPGIYGYCAAIGLDIRSEAIPVAPAAHYFMGGVRTDLHGRTTVPGLYACGEVACTGVHGANRLASNSLMETVVFGKRVAEHIAAGGGGSAALTGDAKTVELSAEEPPSRGDLQKLMWDCAGIERDGAGLSAGAAVADGWAQVGRPALNRNQFELRQMATVARLMLRAAGSRMESRGAHFRTDYPNIDDAHWRRRQVYRRGN